MKKFMILFFLVLTSSCSYQNTPRSEVLYNGDHNIEKKLTDEEYREIFFKTCYEIKCEIFQDNPEVSLGGFFFVIKITSNEEVWIQKDTRQTIFLTISQRNKSKFDNRTLSVLEKLKNMGFGFGLMETKEWVCNGKRLTFENCKRKDTEYDNLDFINFVRSNLSEK